MQIEHINRLAEIYATHRGVEISTVSTYAVNDGKRLKHLKDGGGCTVKTYARLMEFFSVNFPADLEWPRDIPRPSAPPIAAPKAPLKARKAVA